MKKIKLVFGVVALLMTSTSFGADFVCESTDLTSPLHKSTSLEFSDEKKSSSKPIVFKYEGQPYIINASVESQMFCVNNDTGEWQCGGGNTAPISDITYTAKKLTSGDFDFTFELYWEITPLDPISAHYVSVVPHFLGIHQSIVLKCKKDPS